jgi:hypothetical protein
LSNDTRYCYSPTNVLALSRCFYAVAGSCALYISIAAYFSRWHGSPSLVTLGYWLCAVFLLLAAILPTKYGNGLGLMGSAFVTALLACGIARLMAFRSDYINGTGRLGAYQPNPFDRVNQMVSKPISILFLISSLASLLISVLLMFRLRNRTGSPPLTES